jgi:hypothetical protein
VCTKTKTKRLLGLVLVLVHSIVPHLTAVPNHETKHAPVLHDFGRSTKTNHGREATLIATMTIDTLLKIQ